VDRNLRSLPLVRFTGGGGSGSPLNERSLRRLLQMVDEGARAPEIAEAFKVTPHTVRRWKRTFGFDWRPDPDPRLDQLRELWPGPLSIRALGETFGVSGTTIRRWAKAAGLRRRKRRTPPSVEQRVRPRLIAMVRDGRSDKKIAKKLGLAVATVQDYRKNAGYVYFQKRNWSAAELRRLVACRERDMSYSEIARRLNRTPGEVRRKLLAEI